MKTFLFLFLISLTFVGCQPKEPATDMPPKEDPAKLEFEKNLATIKAAISAFENENLDDFGNYVSDSVVYVPAMYGAPQTNKEGWKNLLTTFTTEFDSIRLTHALYLPGIDSVTHVPDGSVRYYGTWVSRHKSGVKTSARFYAVYEFGADGKIIHAQDFFDVTGLLAAVAPKKSK
jgi:hypothetical protein